MASVGPHGQLDRLTLDLWRAMQDLSRARGIAETTDDQLDSCHAKVALAQHAIVEYARGSPTHS